MSDQHGTQWDAREAAHQKWPNQLEVDELPERRQR
jgi:hypothetical protein